MKVAEDPVVVEQTFGASPERVWDAITDPAQMTRWFFEEIPDFAPRVGFETTFVVEVEGKRFPHRWRVTEAIPREKIVYDWSYDGFAGRGLVSFELSEAGGETALRLTNTVLEDFQDDIPEFEREACVGGWRYFIGERLVSYLAGD